MSANSGEKKFRGVSQRRPSGKWRAQIQFSRQHRWLGTYPTVEEAARAYDKVAIELFGRKAILNFPSEHSTLDFLSGLREGGAKKSRGLRKGGRKKFLGVRQGLSGKWVAEIQEPNRCAPRWLGMYDTAEEAARAYDQVARELYVVNAITNVSSKGSPGEFNFWSSESDLLVNLGEEFGFGFSYRTVEDFADVEEVLESFR